MTMHDDIFWNWGGAIRFEGTVPHTVELALSNVVVNHTDPNDPAFCVAHTNSANIGGVNTSGCWFQSAYALGGVNRPATKCMTLNGSTPINVGDWRNAQAPIDSTSVYGAPTYFDPNRNIVTYLATIGVTGTLQDFMALARNQKPWDWQTKYTAAAVNGHIRQGFTRV
jgi:hypothetical protein